MIPLLAKGIAQRGIYTKDVVSGVKNRQPNHFTEHVQDHRIFLKNFFTLKSETTKAPKLFLEIWRCTSIT